MGLVLVVEIGFCCFFGVARWEMKRVLFYDGGTVDKAIGLWFVLKYHVAVACFKSRCRMLGRDRDRS